MKFKGFFHHIFEAIFINISRMPRYAFETYGLSLPVSIGLIGFEISILPLALYYDLFTSHWRKIGLPVMEEDFIAMKHTPPFKSMAQNLAMDIPSESFRGINVKEWRNKTHTYLRNGDWDKANMELSLIRENLEEHKEMYPLCVHFLESVHRAVALTIIWSQKLESLEEKEKFFSWRVWFVFWQMVGFEGALILDFISWPIRRKGCGILESDVPVIPVPKV